VSAREWFTPGAAIDSPPVQHSQRKQPRGLRRKQTEIGAVLWSGNAKSMNFIPRSYCRNRNFTFHF